MNNRREEAVSSSPAEVVDGLSDVIIRLEDNANGGEVMCTICQEKFTDGETAKQRGCNHVYHSHCILLWFRQKVSCPICRYEPTAPQRRDCGVALFIPFIYFIQLQLSINSFVFTC